VINGQTYYGAHFYIVTRQRTTQKWKWIKFLKNFKITANRLDKKKS